ncbi:TLD-domain-containing protein [Pilobolus umbonatus]|nr:TLD-domain-containing protein [Pilobolus umbonatus]
MLRSIQLKDRRLDTVTVLTEEIVASLYAYLPRRYRLAAELKLLYSLDQHGISISTLYRLVKSTKGPVILAIKDSNNNLFGAYLNETLKIGTRYYGTGECFLWKWNKVDHRASVFQWTGKNDYMILSQSDYIAIGGGEGVFGLWIESELEKGYSQPCPTFDNEGLSSHPEFECVDMEIWGFQM